MATVDEFGGVLVENNVTDEFGGVLVQENNVTDEFGGVLVQESNAAKSKQTDEFGGVLVEDAPSSGAEWGFASNLAPNDNKALESFAYGFEKSGSDVNFIKQMLDAKFPEEEPYIKRNIGGKDVWMAKGLGLNLNEPVVSEEVALAANKKAKEIADLPTYEERRAKLQENKLQDVEEKYSSLTQEQKESGAATAGGIAKIFTTPTTLVGGPIWKGPSLSKSVAKFSGVGGLWGAEYSILQQAAETGTIDPKKVALDTTIGAATGGAFRAGAPAIGKGLVQGYKGLKAINKSVTPNKVLTKRANKLVDKIELETALLSKQFPQATDIPQKVKANLKLSDAEFQDAMNRTDKIVSLPNKMDIKQANNVIAKHSKAGSRGWVNKMIVPIHQGLKEIAPKLAARLRQFEFDISDETGRYMRQIKPFIDEIETGFINIGGGITKISKAEKSKLNKHLMNGEYDLAKKILSKYGKGDSLDNVRFVLDELYTRAKNAGVKIDFLANYFPRVAIDSKKLQAAVRNIDLEEGNLLSAELRAAGKNITEEQEAAIIRKRLQAIMNRNEGSSTSNVKNRKIEEVYDELLTFYDSPESALTQYIQNMVGLINKKKFFGNAAEADEIMTINSDKSIVKLLQESDGLETLNQNQLDDVAELLRARFVGGESATGAATSLYKNIIYSTHLGNPYNALTQMGDLGVSTYLEGFWNSISQAFFKKNKIDVKDLGIENWGAELGTSKGFFRALADKSFKVGFSWIDRFGKNNLINAAFNKVSKQIKTQKGLDKLRKEYGDTFGDDFDSFVDAVNRADYDDYNVKLYMFNRLSDAQPISLSEMPSGYLNNPRLRLMYTLKSFAIKQLNILRKDVLNEAKKPGAAAKLNAGKNLAMYTMLVSGANTGVQQVKNIVLGRDEYITPESISEDFANNILKQIFLSRYSLARFQESGKIADLIMDSALPPFDIINNLSEDIMELLKVIGVVDRDNPFKIGGEEYKWKSSKYLPFTGSLGYNFFGGGNEAFEKRKADELWGRR